MTNAVGCSHRSPERLILQEHLSSPLFKGSLHGLFFFRAMSKELFLPYRRLPLNHFIFRFNCHLGIFSMIFKCNVF